MVSLSDLSLVFDFIVVLFFFVDEVEDSVIYVHSLELAIQLLFAVITWTRKATGLVIIVLGTCQYQHKKGKRSVRVTLIFAGFFGERTNCEGEVREERASGHGGAGGGGCGGLEVAWSRVWRVVCTSYFKLKIRYLPPDELCDHQHSYPTKKSPSS
jgi:hypothetical protein